MKKKMALLLATDSWRKMEVFMHFLSSNPKAVWRNRLNYTDEFLNKINYPLNIYFFHRNIIKYKGRCIGVGRGAREDFPLKFSPPQYRHDTSNFKNGIYLAKLEKIKDTHIKEFPKWEDSGTHFEQGQLGLLRVIDIYE